MHDPLLRELGAPGAPAAARLLVGQQRRQRVRRRVGGSLANQGSPIIKSNEELRCKMLAIRK